MIGLPHSQKQLVPAPEIGTDTAKIPSRRKSLSYDAIAGVVSCLER